jgi:hypothetical protein
MPKILHDLAKKMEAKGYAKSKAWALATSILQKQGKLKVKKNG